MFQHTSPSELPDQAPRDNKKVGPRRQESVNVPAARDPRKDLRRSIFATFGASELASKVTCEPREILSEKGRQFA
ncbi:hypothetical protein AA23498_0725 [Acetobacter nitrogenifigens DSM 23921 = NBRC 105050]|uniref:Uncharacterized protein n=1 Tax=Acetobacter nitrogenifigens DSM 23921 = NBRC 105050 TaxID=1120919 RepID=A0A511XDD3_9PROT|nr:hypothetical protein AA23498_0725 [Acetobacter nitrogenifigens DSM 23921 = NBRC 105050]GEN60967.1 hypothetical protein ANI02nite_28510 [Acetobacter nitrogenifigens DSM 23921 = NBRC 105050]